MLIRQIVDEKLAQYAYLIGCQKTGEAIVIDPERDVDRYIAAAEPCRITLGRRGGDAYSRGFPFRSARTGQKN